MGAFWRGFERSEKTAAPRWLKAFRADPERFMGAVRGDSWLKRVQGLLDSNAAAKKLPPSAAKALGEVKPLRKITRGDFIYNNRYGAPFGYGSKGVLFQKDLHPHINELSYADPVKRALVARNSDSTFTKYHGLVPKSLGSADAKRMLADVKDSSDRMPAHKIVGSKKKIDVLHNTDNPAPFAEGPYVGVSGLKDMNRPDAVFAWRGDSASTFRHSGGEGRPVRTDKPGAVLRASVPEHEVIYRPGSFRDSAGNSERELVVPLEAFKRGFKKQAALRAETELQPHQKRVIRRLEKKPGLLVYHGLGSGKTLSSLAATQGQKTDVVVPAALRGNYAKEVKTHTTGHRPNIMSYEKATKSAPTGEALVMDEAHALGDPSSKRTQGMLARAPSYKKRVLLTGTPIRNYPAEIAPLLRAVRGDNAVPLDPKAFNERFVEEVTHKPGLMARILHGAKPGVSYRMKNQGLFSDLVKGYVDYHAPAKEHFPSTSHEVIETPMNPQQMDYYKFVLGKAGPALAWKIRKGMPPSKTEAKSLNSFLTGARQVSNSTAAFGGTDVSPKIQTAVTALKEKASKDKNFKGLVYSNFLASGVSDYAKQLEKEKIPYGVFSGGLTDAKRKQMVQDYNDGKIKVLLVSGAGAQGIDLKGTKLVQLMEPHWNDARMEQAMGRAIRYKSHSHLPEDERHVHVQRFHSTVPQSFLQKVRGKKDMSTDQYLDMLSKDKEKLNDQFLGVLRRVGSKE